MVADALARGVPVAVDPHVDLGRCEVLLAVIVGVKLDVACELIKPKLIIFFFLRHIRGTFVLLAGLIHSLFSTIRPRYAVHLPLVVAEIVRCVVVLHPLDLLRVDWILVALRRVVHEACLKLAHKRCLNQVGAHAYTVVWPQEPFLVDGSLFIFCERISAAVEPAALVVVVAGRLSRVFFLGVVDDSLVVLNRCDLGKIVEARPGLGELNVLCSAF